MQVSKRAESQVLLFISSVDSLLTGRQNSSQGFILFDTDSLLLTSTVSLSLQGMSDTDIQTLGESLDKACWADDTDRVKRILESVSDDTDRLAHLLSVRNDYGSTPLLTAASYSTDKTVTHIISSLNSLTADQRLRIIEIRDALGDTLLHVSAQNRRSDTVCLQLLQFLLSVYSTSPGT